MFYPTLNAYIKQMVSEYDQIPSERKAVLAKITDFIQSQQSEQAFANLNFICTHNSRRSHLGAIWTKAAAEWHGIPKVQTFSGGTEATAFNPRAVAALERTGFSIQQTTWADNPIYHIRFQDEGPAMTAFSKVYNQAPNPLEGYCAVMTCSSADDACPVVFGASERIAVTYQDPKISDGMPEEAQTYDQRALQIGREMFYALSLVK